MLTTETIRRSALAMMSVKGQTEQGDDWQRRPACRGGDLASVTTKRRCMTADGMSGIECSVMTKDERYHPGRSVTILYTGSEIDRRIAENLAAQIEPFGVPMVFSYEEFVPLQRDAMPLGMRKLLPGNSVTILSTRALTEVQSRVQAEKIYGLVQRQPFFSHY